MTSDISRFEAEQERAVVNTDRELWRGPDEGNGDYYADSIHVTEGGGIGINCGGHVIVKPLRDWFALASPAPHHTPEAGILSEEIVEKGVEALWGRLKYAGSIPFEEAVTDSRAQMILDSLREDVRAVLTAALPDLVEACAISEEPHLTMKLVGGKMISDGRPYDMSFSDFAGEVYKAMTRRLNERAKALSHPISKEGE